MDVSFDLPMLVQNEEETTEKTVLNKQRSSSDHESELAHSVTAPLETANTPSKQPLTSVPAPALSAQPPFISVPAPISAALSPDPSDSELSDSFLENNH